MSSSDTPTAAPDARRIELGPADASVEIYTYKEGVLAAAGHDLRLVVSRFRISGNTDKTSGEATLEAASLTVGAARRNGRDVEGVLSAADRRQIENSIRKDVLKTDRFPDIRFVATAVRRAPSAAVVYEVEGSLRLLGAERPVRIAFRAAGDRLRGELTLHQPDFGIKPFSALFGTLRVKPDVDVVVDVPWPAGEKPVG